MKKIISGVLIATLVLASVLAMIPVSAETPTEYNLMWGFDVAGEKKSNANEQWNGEGNVFYYDYYKYLDLGNTFPMSDYGNTDYMIRYPNVGNGSASVCDGIKASGGVNHNGPSADGRNINDLNNDGEIDNSSIKYDEKYNQVFGYSFKESVIADKITLYIPAAEGLITEIDIYGGTVDKDNKIFALNTDKTLLASFDGVKDTTATPITEGEADPVDMIVITSELNEAFKMDYLFIAVKLENVNTFKIYEIELNGILAKDAADFTALKEQYGRYNDLNESDWTEASWTALETALAETDKVNKNATSTADEIAAAATTLKNAMDALEAKPADKTALNAAITAAPADTDEAKYTPATWAAYKTALEAAVAANSKEKIAQTDVDNALANLKAAIDGLKVPADKAALTAAIAKYGELEETDYTPMTWEALGTPLAKAMSLSTDVNATQEDIDAAVEALTKAINDLAKPGNKDALTAAIKSAKELNQANYKVTALTWNVFTKSIDDAQAVIDDVNATQGDVDFALAELNEKIEGLGKPVTGNDENDDANNNAGENEGENDGAEDENTATDAPVTDAPITDAPAATTPEKKGCGSAVATTAVVLGLVATLGTALVIKKKD